MHNVKTGIWRHYKGEYYYVLCVGQHTERDEVLVTYIPLTGNEGRKGLRVRHRPLTGPEGFMTLVVGTTGEMDRFEYVGDEMDKVRPQKPYDGHPYGTHPTYTGSGCAVCGRPREDHAS